MNSPDKHGRPSPAEQGREIRELLLEVVAQSVEFTLGKYWPVHDQIALFPVPAYFAGAQERSLRGNSGGAHGR